MAYNRRKKRYHRGRRKKGNWFTRMRVWQKVLLCFALVLIGVLGAATWYVTAMWNKLDTTAEEIKTEDLIINQEVKQNVDLGEGYTNVALFGVDSREGELESGSRTDCIIVASLNNETKEIRMVSIYRDTLLDLSEGTYQKCNAAYSYGGAVQAINMLNMNLDLDIQKYVTVDFAAISDVIDLLGGLEIDVTEEEAMEINQHIVGTAEEAGKAVHLMEHGGLQLLDGVQATTYARVRSTEGGDFTRTERQRLVIQKIVEKAVQMDLGTLNDIINQVFPQISTNFTLAEVVNYATAYREYILSENVGFPYEDYLGMDTIPDVGSSVIPMTLVDNVSRLHEFLFGTVGYVPSSTVQNISSNISYLASTSTGTSTASEIAEETTETYTYTEEVPQETVEYYPTEPTPDTYVEDNSGYVDDGTGGGTMDNTTGGYDETGQETYDPETYY